MKHILQEYNNTPWAILPEKLIQISEVLRLRASGNFLSDEEIKDRIGAVNHREPRQAGAVAVIPLYGVIAQRMNMFSAMSGGTSTELLTKQIRQAVNDPSVGVIVLDVDSPGGSVYGIQELGDEIYKAREVKKVVAVSNSLSASAAYWIGSSANELVVTPGGEVGSIGVIAAHEDWSAFVNATDAGHMALPKVTFITAGKYKAEGNFYEPLTEEAHAYMQKRVDEYYDGFVKAVARNRGDTPGAVRSGYGQARTVGAKEALSLNMADRIDTLDETIKRLSTSRNQRVNSRAAAERDLQLRI